MLMYARARVCYTSSNLPALAHSSPNNPSEKKRNRIFRFVLSFVAYKIDNQVPDEQRRTSDTRQRLDQQFFFDFIHT